MLALALLLALAAPAQQALPAVKAPALEVDDDFGPSTPGWLTHRFARISEALLVVPDGGTLEVRPGLYAEDLVLTRPVVLRSTVPGAARLVGAGGPQAVRVQAEHVTLEGFEFQVFFSTACELRSRFTRLLGNSGTGTVDLFPGSSDNVLARNRGLVVVGGRFGQDGSHRNRIEDNELVSLALTDSDDNLILGNTLAGGATTLLLTNGVGNRVEENDLDGFQRAIEVRGESALRIERNTVRGGYSAIDVTGADGCVVKANTIAGPSTFAALHIAFSDGVVCTDNQHGDPGASYGLLLYECVGATLTGNALAAGGLTLSSASELAAHFDSHVITGNTLAGREVRYLVGQPDFVAPAGLGQLLLVDCPRATVSAQTFTDAPEGLQLFESDDVLVEDCTFERSGIRSYRSSGTTLRDSTVRGGGVRLTGDELLVTGNVLAASFDGLWLQGSFGEVSGNSFFDCATAITLGGAPASSNLVADNRIEGSSFRGILMFGATTQDNELRGNRIVNCARGIELSAAPGNRVLENTLTGNPTGLRSSAASGNVFARNDLAGPLEAQDLGSSEWDDGSQGNYWQSYTGLDLDDDGIGDTPQAISGGEQDRFPLMAQQGPLMLSSSTRTLSAVSGGQVTFTLHAGAAHAGRAYLLLGSASGTTPGIPLPGGLVLPLAHDPFTAYVQANLGSPEFFGFQGVLDGSGSATATWTRAPLGTAYVGRHLEFAWALVSPWERVSHPLSLELVE